MVKKLFFILFVILPPLCCYNQTPSLVFTPTPDLNSTINTYLTQLGKDFNSEEIKYTYKIFLNIKSSPNYNTLYEEKLCNCLNALNMQQKSFPAIRFFLSAFYNMLNNKDIQLNEQWIKTVCMYNYDLLTLKLWDDFFRDNTISYTTYSKWQLSDIENIQLAQENDSVYVIFKNKNLFCPSYDSVIILNCTGRINIISKCFEGKKGIVNWDKAGLHPDSVYAELPENYKLTLNNVSIDIDSVQFHFLRFFQTKTLTGKLSDRCIQGANKNNTRYPKFASYPNVCIPVKNIYPDIEYLGGFAIDGNNIAGTGSDSKKAEINIYRNKRVVVNILSDRFAIQDLGFGSNNVYFSIYTAKDSIQHTSSGVSYNAQDKELVFKRDPLNRGNSPFSSSYHRLNIYSDQIIWYINTDDIVFSSANSISNSEGKAFFESKNFFSADRFRQFETPDGTNSILKLLEYIKFNPNEFYLYEYAEYCKKSEEQVKTSLLLMSNFGLVSYDLSRDRIKVNKKLQDYVSAFSKNKDYDIISIFSSINNNKNAVLNINTDTLTVNGVKQLVFSDKNNVVLFPNNDKIVMSEDLNILFSGYLQAGLLDFYIQEGSFDYNSFKMNLQQIDSMSFFVASNKFDRLGKPILSKINSPIQNLSGILEINKFFNKSGNMDFPEYPKFTCTSKGHIYYDKPNICDGIYNRETFYFLVDNFEIDSLQTYIPNNLSLEGTFISAGIFPDFKEKVTIMPDLSLGFVHTTPSGGYAMYGGKGKYYDKIILSNNCLKGQGKIDYLTAVLKSNEFSIFPDSVSGVVEQIDISKSTSNVEYPKVFGNSSRLLWDVPQNYMRFQTISGEPYYMYNNYLTLSGLLYYSPEYIKGKGLIQKDNANIYSDDFFFKADDFFSDSCHFQLFLPNKKYTAIDANNYSLSFNVKHNNAFFTARNNNNSEILFKDNLFSIYFKEFEWKTDKNIIEFGGKYYSTQNNLNKYNISSILDTIPTGYLATSLNKNYDSLQFLTKFGTYDIFSQTISLKGIDYIKISDAAIIPNEGTITISSGGTILPLNNCFIIFNVKQKYHIIYDASISISSKSKIKGSGFYDYIDNINRETPLFVENISSDTNYVKGISYVPELRPLSLNSAVDFQGTVTLYNHSNDLDFNGYYSLIQPCFENNTWVQLEADTKPNNLQLPIHHNILSKNNKNVFSGIVFSNPGANIYPAFLSEKNRTSDFLMLDITGMLSFENEKYKIVDTTTNKHLALNTEVCNMVAAGNINFLEIPSRIKLLAAGDVNYLFINNNISLNLSLCFDYHFNNNAMQVLANELNSLSESAYTISTDKYLSALSYLLPKDSFETYNNDLLNYGTVEKKPDILSSQIVISNIKLIWNDSTKVFYSDGPISIASIKGEDVNKNVDGVMEISKYGGTESVSLILIIKNSITGAYEKYFFYYINNTLFTYSTNDDFSDLIRKDSKKVRLIKRKGGLPPYQYIIATSEQLSSFCRKYGIK